MKGSPSAQGCCCSLVEGVSIQWGAGRGQSLQKNQSLAGISELIINKNSYSIVLCHRIHQLSYRPLSTVHSSWKKREFSVRVLLQGLFQRWGAEIPPHRGRWFNVSIAAVQTHPEIHSGLYLRPGSEQGRSALVPGQSLWSVPQGPVVLPGGAGAAHFPGKVCAEITDGACWQAEPSGAPVWAQFWHLCTLNFPQVAANLPGSAPGGTQGCWKDWRHREVLVIYPGSINYHISKS